MLCALVIAICFLFSRCAPRQATHDVADNTGRADKVKMETLAAQLLIEAKLYQRQVMQVRQMHSPYLAYEVGLIIGNIREKYKRMMEVYHEAITKRDSKFNIYPPTIVDGYRSIHYLILMETMRGLEMDIDKHIHVLETIPDKMLADYVKPPPPSMSDLNATRPNGTDPGQDGSLKDLPEGINPQQAMLRTADEDFKFIGSTTRPLSADDVKQAYRDQYYSRTRNENWTLDGDYGFGA